MLNVSTTLTWLFAFIQVAVSDHAMRRRQEGQTSQQRHDSGPTRVSPFIPAPSPMLFVFVLFTAWMCFRAERNAVETSKRSVEPSETSRGSVGSSGSIDGCVVDKDAPSSPDVQPPLNPFDGLKSEDEEEELAVPDRPEEEEEEEDVDEAELEAFLDGQLAHQLLQEGSSQSIVEENDHIEFNSSSSSSSKADEALRTCKILLYFLKNVSKTFSPAFLSEQTVPCSSGDAETGYFHPHVEQRGGARRS